MFLTLKLKWQKYELLVLILLVVSGSVVTHLRPCFVFFLM